MLPAKRFVIEEYFPSLYVAIYNCTLLFFSTVVSDIVKVEFLIFTVFSAYRILKLDFFERVIHLILTI